MVWSGEFFANVNPTLTARNQGLKTIDAVCELIDNALDAEATEIHITPFKPEKGKLALIVEDDGVGFPKSHKLDDGTGDVDGLRYALAYGGSVSSTNKRRIGKFGAGLTIALSCQAAKSDVYTKTQEDNGVYRHNEINFHYLEKSGNYLPETDTRDPFSNSLLSKELKLEENEHGSIIYLNELDNNPDRTTMSYLADYLANDIARVYRYYIASGIKIHVYNRRDTKESEVQLYDPLMANPQSKWYGELGPGIEYTIDKISQKTSDGKEYDVEIKVYRLNTYKVRINPDYSVKWMNTHGMNIANQGFSMIRNKREIGLGYSHRIFEKHNQYNYLRAEIIFPSELDTEFGVQVNKSRYSLSESLRDKIKSKLDGVISRVKTDTIKDVYRATAYLSQKKLEEGKRESEDVVKRVSDDGLLRLKKPSKSQKIKIDRDLARVKESRKQQVLLDVHLSDDEKQEKIGEIEEFFNSVTNTPIRLILDALGTGEFFEVRDLGEVGGIELALDTIHPFYNRVYELSRENPAIATALEIFLFSFAHANVNIQRQRRKLEADEWLLALSREWSATLRTLLDAAVVLKDHLENVEYDMDIQLDNPVISEKTVVEQVVDVLNAENVPMTLGEIYNALNDKSTKPLDAGIKKSIRSRIYEYSSDSEMYLSENEDYFYREGSKNKAKWGLRTAYRDEGIGLHSDERLTLKDRTQPEFEEETLNLIEECIKNSRDGKMTLDAICRYVKKYGVSKPPPNADRHIRAIVFRHSSDHPGFDGKENKDIFSNPSENWMKGLWGLNEKKMKKGVE